MNILELIDKTQDENSNNVNNSDNDLVIDHIENTTTETETTTEEIDSTSANNNDNNNSEYSSSNDEINNLTPLHLPDNTENDQTKQLQNDDKFEDLFILDKFFKLCEAQKLEQSIKYLMPSLELCATHDEYMRVFSCFKNACFYNDVILRSIWIEQLPNVVQYFQNQNLLDDDLNTDIAIIISNLMQFTTYQVRKIASSVLVTLVERNFIDTDKMEQYIMPCLLNLVNENNDEINIECISLFGKLAPLIGRELTVKHLLVPFCRLCSSPVFHTRKVCATNIGEIATIVSSKEVEEHLLPHFSDFIKDQVWAIRKVCAEIFATIANKCSREIRESILTDCFIHLLEDSSRWVKISAYKTLGSFIATFLKDEKTTSTTTQVFSNRQIEQNEAKSFYNNSKNDKKLFLATLLTTKSNTNNNNRSQQSLSIRLDNESDENETTTNVTTTTPINTLAPIATVTLTTKAAIDSKTSSLPLFEYSNFIYWRDTLPELKFDEANDSIIKHNELEIEIDCVSQQEDIYKIEKQRQKSNQNLMYRDFNGVSGENYQNEQKTVNIDSELNEQDIVPAKLLSYFITMVDMNAQTSLDSEMNYNCAFNFPAIANTLGPSYWKYIKDLYKRLSEDVNWKVRQTLAYSIHELAQILGPEVTQIDLVPTFDSYIKDVDEVRIGIVSNLAMFLKILNMEYRQSYMPKLNDFLKMDNQRNWRFRNELGLQISEFCELFPVDCIAKFIQPIAFTLALDKVAEVRLTAVGALIQILKQFIASNEENYRKNFVDDTIRTFAKNEKWTFRQLYTTLCSQILEQNADNFQAFSCDFLPHLLSLRNDKVPNIRLSLARVLSNYMDILKSLTNEEFSLTIESLSQDKDSDVHSFFVKTEISTSNDLSIINEAINTDSSHIPGIKVSTVINVDLLNDSLNDLNLGNNINESTTGEHSS